jgi:predicted oxidoreductase
VVRADPERSSRRSSRCPAREQNPDITSKAGWPTASRRGKGAPPPVEAFKKHGEDFVVRDNLADLVAGMNALAPDAPLDHDRLKAQIEARDREIANPFTKDAQVTAMRGARNYVGDRLIRTAKPHRILDPANGPLIAVRLNVLTRKTLGGLHTDLDARVLDRRASRSRASTRRARSPASAAAAITATTRWKAPSSAAASFSGRSAGRHAAKSA